MREKSLQVVITFHTTSAACHGRLCRARPPGPAGPAPRDVTSDCGIAVRARLGPADLEPSGSPRSLPGCTNFCCEGPAMQTLNLKQLEAFVAVVESGSFTAAAERLFLAQSTISGHVAALEKDLGVALLLRTGRRQVALTEEGPPGIRPRPDPSCKAAGS